MLSNILVQFLKYLSLWTVYLHGSVSGVLKCPLGRKLLPLAMNNCTFDPRGGSIPTLIFSCWSLSVWISLFSLWRFGKLTFALTPDKLNWPAVVFAQTKILPKQTRTAELSVLIQFYFNFCHVLCFVIFSNDWPYYTVITIWPLIFGTFYIFTLFFLGLVFKKIHWRKRRHLSLIIITRCISMDMKMLSGWQPSVLLESRVPHSVGRCHSGGGVFVSNHWQLRGRRFSFTSVFCCSFLD